MKVLLINNFHYRRGGSEAVYFNMADMLRRHGHEVIFFSCIDSRNEGSAQARYFVRANSELGLLRGGIRYFYNTEAARRLEQLVQDERPDIAHVHLFWGGLSSSIFGVLRKYHIPLVHTVHDYRMVCPAYTFRLPQGEVCERCKGRNFIHCVTNCCSKGSFVHSTIMATEAYFRNLFFNPVKNIAGFVFVSHFAEEIHRRYMPLFAKSQSVVAYNAVPQLDERFVSRQRGGYYLFFGRLSYEKGVATLVNAFIAMPSARLKIVGTGPEERTLKDMVETAGAENIEFLGYRSGDALKEIVRDAAFVVVPSEWYENNPMTIIEAYSAGVPVVGANIGGIPEIVAEGKTGFLFEPKNVEALKATIQRAESLSNEEYVAMSRSARTFAAENFSEGTAYRKITQLYSQILDNYAK